MLESVTSGGITISGFLMCLAASLILGALAAAIYMYKNSFTKSFVVSLVILPAIVQLVIMLVNGNIGTGVAVAGAFSLVRFRSVPGGAREICSIFLAMALGLATGLGYLGFAAIAFVVIAAAMLVLSSLRFGEGDAGKKELKITIPENLDYEGIFDDIFQKYLSGYELIKVKTKNMGTLYELCYLVTLRDSGVSKAFLDELRCRNGNLTIMCGKVSTEKESL